MVGDRPHPVSRATSESVGREALWSAMRTVLQAQRVGPPLERIARNAPHLASFGQRRLWFVERLIPGSATYNQTVAYRLSGLLSLSALERSLQEIVRRHEALRTTLRWVNDELIQHVHPPTPFVMRVEDLRVLDETARALRVEQATELEAREPFNLDRSPLLRAALLRLADDQQRLVVTMHHLAFDGWSFDVFMRELCGLYDAFVANAPPPLTELPVQYVDFAAWQRARLQGATLERLLDYWLGQMGGALPVLRMPADHPRRGPHCRRGQWHELTVAKALTPALERLASEEGATLPMLLLAAFQVLLHRYTGEQDIVVGSPTANRHRVEIEPLIGLFVNTVAIRTRFRVETTFRDVLASVRKTMLDAYEHQELPFEMLVEALGATARADATPLFQAMFAFQNLPRSRWLLPGLTVEAWNVGNGTAKFDLTLFMWDTPEGLGGLLEYDADLFDSATALQWLRHFGALLEGIACDPAKEIAKLSMLDDAERRQVLVTWNATGSAYPSDLPIHRAFANIVAEAPEATALAFDGGIMSYGELDRHSNRLARSLQRRGASPGALVGICLERSPLLIASLLATLKTGAAFVPIDPSWPAERMRLALARAVTVVAGIALDSRLSALGIDVMNIDRESASIDRECDYAIDVCVAAEDLAYVMFTSGSTGVPKGVCVPHRGVVRLVQGANYAELLRTDVFLQLAPVSFDASTFEIWGALLNGATLVLPAAEQPSLDAIAHAIGHHRVSVLWLTTGLFAAMVDARVADLAPVRQLLVGGDVLSVPHAERLLREAPACRLINCYGPTENTTFTTFHVVHLPACAPGESIPVGRPVSNSQVYVLDRALQPVPLGVAGQAYVGGDGLMRGYLDDPAATREHLVSNPFTGCPGAWLYRTGDIMRWRRDGVLEFLGRDDDQVKIRGFRVELGEVQAILGSCPAVAQVSVVADADQTNGKRLIAFVVPAVADRSPDELARDIRDFLRERVPAYLVPSHFVPVDKLPLAANGKVDREQLKAMGASTRIDPLGYVVPRQPTERTITEAFQEILGVPRVGVDDDFFDAGGSSLAALRLVAMLEDLFQVSLPLVSLYEYPTPAQLAALIARMSVQRLPAIVAGGLGSMLVEIKRGRCDPPLFLVPGGHGGMAEMTLYAKMLRHVAREQPVYGLLAHGVDGRGRPHSSVEEMAAAYVDEVRRSQPRGPYAIAGECVGGLIAFEMAQRLIAQQQEIALLLLLDTWWPTLAGVWHYRHVERPRTLLAARRTVARRGIADVRSVLRDHVRDRPPFAPLLSLRYGVNVARTLLRVARPWVDAVNAVGKVAPGTDPIATAEANYVERTLRYRPRRYPGPVTLIVTAANERLGLGKPWRAMAGGGLAVRVVPGDHESYLRETPHLAARIVEDCLDEALGSGERYVTTPMRTERA
jgi:amino acid adenylation domain-containing protein